MNIVFVCSGNQCRSPTAAALLRAALEQRVVADRLFVESRGTLPAIAGTAPPPLAIEVAVAHGIDISGHRARSFGPEDFAGRDLVVAMDLGHMDLLRFIAPPGAADRLRMMMSYLTGSETDEVPDPMGGTIEDFEKVFGMLAAATRAMAGQLTARDR